VHAGVNRPLMYGALLFETLTSGLGMGAFGVLLIRMTERRFSATQYALFSSLFALPRIVAGPITGFVVYAFGWGPFFWFTMVCGIPGMVLLARFAPWHVREPTFEIEQRRAGGAGSRRTLLLRGLRAGLAAWLLGHAVQIGTAVLSAHGDGRRYDLAAGILDTLWPAGVKGWIVWIGIVVFGILGGLVGAAYTAARKTPPS
jgi:PAT family beta-lactamase induction signal transducer AmpG